MRLPRELNNCTRSDEPLAWHTSFRIGGPVEYFVEPRNLEELRLAIGFAQSTGRPYLLIGSGTNVLGSDRGLAGLVIRLSHPAFAEIVCESSDDSPDLVVRCGAGVATQRLVLLAAQRGLAGAASLAGLPGTVGGAIAMNAQNICRFVTGITTLHADGSLHTLEAGDFDWSYRYTDLQGGLVLEATLRFAPADAEETACAIRTAYGRRRATQELTLPSAGCAFKNPQTGEGSGALIDRAGLKGERVGDAQVSLRHANFIVNLGRASSCDVLQLMERMQRRVADEFGVTLEPEVRILGEKWQ
ncbi:MAG: UDP-N-acetylmuramate dehydrogenase [Candidatus Omnitrophica bacterium]|nr:UDP-N-acetylmuramate dehydrogenase [Candidatus Omnitrophota bacterium]